MTPSASRDTQNVAATWWDRSPNLAAFGAAVFLLLLNAFLCNELFSREFTERMESIESSYMSISQWAMHHWGDLRWFPEWFDGMPFHRVYQPGFHLTVAALGTALGWTAQHAYHFFTAFEYCLGPVTLFWLCYRATKWLGASFAAGIFYSLISPVSLLVNTIRDDTGSLITARRFIVLVRYGEGPHTTAVMLIPVVLLALHYAVTERRWWGIIAAPLALAALVLTNWPGTMGLCMGILAYIVSRIGSDRPIHWPTMVGVAAVAYLIVCPWIPPSIIAAVQLNAQQSDATMLGDSQLYAGIGMLAALFLLHHAMERAQAPRWLRFFAYYTLITGAISVGREWFGWRLIPQPNRFQVEFELAACGLAALCLHLLYVRAPRVLRQGGIAVLALVCLVQAVRFRKFAEAQTRAIDITRTDEYKMARWFDANMHGHRVFAPGNTSLWMNMFTETPQMGGCCDQGMPSNEYRVSTYAIYTGQNAGARDAEISEWWLKAYGADAVGVTGPKSTEVFHPFVNPHKFDGLLPVLWRDGDNVVYDVQRRSKSLAHVITREQMVQHAPENGLLVEHLMPYVNAIEAPGAPRAEFHWMPAHNAQVTADLHKGQLVSVQISSDPGWEATVAGQKRPQFADALSMMVIDPQCEGACTIDLRWTGGREASVARVAQWIGFVLLIGWSLWLRFRRSQQT
jgi:hypothetical protein